jgi:integrase
MSWKEIGLLLAKGFSNDPEMRRFYTVAIFTGLRTSELIGLKWGDLDWTTEPPRAHIKRSFTKLDGEHLTKTKGSARTIDLRPQAIQAVKEQQATSRLKSEFLFCNSIGGPLDRDNLMNRVWYPALKRAGIRERKPYQTRHTFASLALSAGEEIGWVARQLGHASTEMVIRHYYRWVRNNHTPGRLGVRQGSRAIRAMRLLLTAETRQNERQKIKGLTGYNPVSP